MVRNATVRIDALPESAFRYLQRFTIVCIDVLCSSTTAVTSAAQGRRTIPAGSVEEAFSLARATAGAILAGDGFAVASSPAGLSRRSDRMPLVFLDPPGTVLMANCRGGREVYVACLRNLTATAELLASRGDDVVLLGAGVGCDSRCEDRMAAARIARALVARGFKPEGQGTADMIERWGAADRSLLAWGRSAKHLRLAGQSEDLEFVLDHWDDLQVACRYRDEEVVVSEIGSTAMAISETSSHERR